MTGQNLLDEINNSLIDDEIGDTQGLVLINFVKNLVEDARDWLFLQKEDESLTVTPSDTFLTQKDLPDDFVSDISLFIGSDDDEDYQELAPIPFSRRRRHKDVWAYYIDWANFKLHISADVSETKTIFLNYIYQTDDIALNTSPVWPSRYHKIISFLASAIWSAGIDVDDLTLRQARELSFEGNALYQSMIQWDSKMRLKAMNGQAGFRRKHHGAITDRIQAPELGNV